MRQPRRTIGRTTTACHRLQCPASLLAAVSPSRPRRDHPRTVSTPKQRGRRADAHSRVAAASIASPRRVCRDRHRAPRAPRRARPRPPPPCTTAASRSTAASVRARGTPTRVDSDVRPTTTGSHACPHVYADHVRTQGCRATSTSFRRQAAPSPDASSGGPTVRRSRTRTGRSRIRGAEKIKSVPPPCRSMVRPSSRNASAEHSMCQPGRPGPHNDVPAGLVAARRLPQHEVERVALVRDRRDCHRARGRTRASARGVVHSACRSPGTSTRRSTHRRRPAYACPRSSTMPMKPRMSGMADVARGSLHASSMPSASMSSSKRRISAAAEIEVVHAELAGGLRRSRSSTSVMLRTQWVSWPQVAQPALQHVIGDECRGVAEMRGVVGSNATRVERHHWPGREIDHCAAGSVEQSHRSRTRPHGGQTLLPGDCQSPSVQSNTCAISMSW